MGVLIVCVFVLVLYSGWSAADFTFLDLEVQNQCIQKCPLQNRTDDGRYGIGCGYECNIEQCTQGCKIWTQALESSCREVCNGTQEILPPKELYCVMGCNDAMTRYFSILRERIGTPPAPALVADSLTATSLRLEWDFGGARYAGVRYLVQWRYEELAATWQYCGIWQCMGNQTWGPQSTVLVDNLQPYTKYRFRVALLLSNQHGETIVSEPSVVISTLPSGIPASPPAIVRAVPVDWSRISVSWEPGPFPHGPILSYVLNISENHPHGYSALKDIAASVNNFYMLTNLLPGRNYSVSVSMRNGVGEGPAATVFVSTPEEPSIKDTQKPILILGTHKTVIQQDADMSDEQSVLYKSEDYIQGLAIHISRQLLFISDSKGYIHQTSLTGNTNSTILLTPQQLKFQPLDLSIDWLNEQLYILGEVSHNSRSKVFQITRYGLDGGGLTVAVAGLSKPHHIEVDPYNGYLFWVMNGSSRPGLYRLDLADISNGIKHYTQPDIILEQSNLGAFTVDHTKFHLLVPDHSNNTVYSVSFDGREIVDLRSNTQQSLFHNVLSLATANGLFYWTNGDEVLIEEFGMGSYYHNSLSGHSYMTVLVNLPSCQPTPIPVNPPTAVQAILGPTIAKTSWQIPHLLGGQGKGAWQNWSYEIHIKDVGSSKVISHKNINTTSYTIKGLKENTEYIIKAAAYTSSGTGPWSSEFKGKTLKKPIDDKYPAILWSAAEGLLKSDVTGENVQTLIHKTSMKEFFVTNIAWYEDMLYFVSNTSHMYWYNMTNHNRGRLNDIDSVGSVAIDWVGKKLYWSNPKQQLIIRGNLTGNLQEPLPILTVAKELYVDAINAYIYWSTGHSVECARLNGVERQVYHPAQLFSGKQVMGLTLDNDQEMVYWIVRSHEGSTLFKQRMAQYLPVGGNIPSIKVSNLQKPNMQGPLCYFDDHLLWLQDDRNAVIGDMNGQNAAVISGISLSGLSTVSILDPSLHIWTKNPNMSVIVIPEPVFKKSVRFNGTWDSFYITWAPITYVNYGQLFYEIKIDDILEKDMTRVTTKPYIQYWKTVPPYTPLNVMIRAYTYWGSAPPTRAQLHTPSSTPSVPQNARCYVMYNYHPLTYTTISILFRWSAPEYSNGVINGYVVKFWMNEEMINVKETVIKPEDLQYALYNLTEDKIYHFQVQAFTEMGNGEYSNITSCNTSIENPVPELLIASTDSIYIQDFDTHKSEIMIENIVNPIKMAYMMTERKLFWLNELNELYFANQNFNKTKLLTIKQAVPALTIDWIERSLYFVENNVSGKEFSVFKLNLNDRLVFEGKGKKEFVLKSPNKIIDLKVSPFTREIYWMEVNQKNKNVLMQAPTDGKNRRNFFGKNRHAFKRMTNQEYLPCNCPSHENIESIFSIDHSNTEKPKLIFINSNTHEIISSDKHGCYCDAVLNADTITESLPLINLAKDINKIYWSNSTNKTIYYINKKDNILLYENTNGNNFLLHGSHIQPFPATQCLFPQLISQTVKLHSKTSHSVTLNLPEIKAEDDCDNLSVASVEFTIFYKKFIEEDDQPCNKSCNQVITFEKQIEITLLKPFTKYIFFISVSNYFSDLKEVPESIGPGIIFQTAPGAPTKPRNVTAVVLNPTVVEVKWLPPIELNGESVLYEIHWQGTISGVRRKGEQVIFRDKEPLNLLNKIPKYKVTVLNKLSPNQTYSLWIRAYSENNRTYNDSNTISVHTFPEPNDIILLNCTSTTLIVSWNMTPDIKHYIIQYTNFHSSKWKDVTNTSQDNIISIYLQDLTPKTRYMFRLNLKYLEYPEWFVWPKDSRFTFETLGDRPSPPGVPVIQHVKRDVYQISWEASKENGAPILMYNLQGLGFHNYRSKRNTNRTAWFHTAPSVEEKEYEWISYYNGTDTYWLTSAVILNDKLRYSFRVLALNDYGWSDPSEESVELNISAASMLAERNEQMGIILGISVPVIVLVFSFLIFCFIYLRRKDKEKKTPQTMLIAQPVAPDVELATLRELPRRDNFIHNTNALYVSSLPSAEELALLPQINRDQITLINFLGRGAFGEVYEGKAKGIGENGDEIKVAVKTLRKGATEQEKIEFLQEAQLMSHFKHEHILQLLGVCLDTHFIIMELMQGGDLLTYLRSNRKPTSTNEVLTILDLLSMCVDVARGCRYLEEMHFVHRDLACRNCLVSSKDRQSRVVKIGDFGLARDIYKNDYYRKEGEGLLPVRWMAPESLVDGVFTCQSDVWAFGVLMWEIMTLGQQPYPARNNLEVLHYVKGGGRLEKPMYCPEELHRLMMLCWSYQPENRPTFKYSLEVLEQLRNSTTDKSLTAVHSGNYISSVPNGTSWKTDENSGRDHTPLMSSVKKQEATDISKKQSTEIPKYLEIICDSYLTSFSDGYEIPRSSMRKCGKKTNEPTQRSRTFSNSSTLSNDSVVSTSKLNRDASDMNHVQKTVVKL